MSILWLIYVLVACSILALQQFLLRHQVFWRRVLHFAIATTLLALLVPILFSWRHQAEVPVQNRNLGCVLWDSSASCASLQKEKKAFRERLEKLGTIEFIEFSQGCLPPLGPGKAGGSTDLDMALTQVAERIAGIAPDWVWVVSDGGCAVPSSLPENLRSIPLYLSPWQEVLKASDISLDSCSTDPVWYSRSEAALAIKVSRSSVDAPSQVDILVKMDGRLATRVVAHFQAGQLHTQVQTQLKAEHLGSVVIEMLIAEGQGGSIVENDHLLHVNRILRDRVRILRVVGRPNWSSKFLRDQLVQREDVDLVDFHILRSIRDRVMAGPDELALIPFPVEELFVDNIDSFDLIIWQNFDHENYPFFKEEFLINIAKAVDSGCGLLLWNGTLPWSLENGPLSTLAPVSNRGLNSEYITGLWNCSAGEFLEPLFGTALRSLGQSTLHLFPGRLNANARVVLTLGGTPAIAIKEVGRGRVLQVCSDEFWNWGLHPPRGLEGFYSAMIQRSLMWLQHDPTLEHRTLQCPENMKAGERIELKLLEPLSAASRIIWSTLEGETLLSSDVPSGQSQITVNTPKVKGLVKLALEGRPAQMVALQGQQGEFINSANCKENLMALESLGFKSLDFNSGKPKESSTSVLMRSDGEPWHTSWWFLALYVGLLCAHWLSLNRMLDQR